MSEPVEKWPDLPVGRVEDYLIEDLGGGSRRCTICHGTGHGGGPIRHHTVGRWSAPNRQGRWIDEGCPAAAPHREDGEGDAETLEHAAKLLALTVRGHLGLHDEELREMTGNSNVAVLRHWMEAVFAALAGEGGTEAQHKIDRLRISLESLREHHDETVRRLRKTEQDRDDAYNLLVKAGWVPHWGLEHAEEVIDKLLAQPPASDTEPKRINPADPYGLPLDSAPEEAERKPCSHCGGSMMVNSADPQDCGHCKDGYEPDSAPEERDGPRNYVHKSFHEQSIARARAEAHRETNEAWHAALDGREQDVLAPEATQSIYDRDSRVRAEVVEKVREAVEGPDGLRAIASRSRQHGSPNYALISHTDLKRLDRIVTALRALATTEEK